MAELRVLQVGKFYPPDEGGMESHLEGLCRHLSPHARLEVLVASRSRQTTHETIDGVSVTRVGTVATIRSAPVCPELRWRIRQSDADVIHLHHPNPSAFLSYLVSGHRGRLIVTYHSDVVQQRLLNAVYEPIVRAVLARADAIIVSSQEYMDTSPMLERYRDRCVVIPMAIDPERFATADPEAVSAIRHAHGDRLVLAVGRLVYYKGLEFLVRAMGAVRGHALVIGQGPMRESLEAEARALGVSDRVTFLGHVPDPIPFYHAAQVFALPSHRRSEAFGIVQLEAMAAGLPVVNTRIPSGVPGVSVDGLTGITVSPGDPAALAAALNALLDDPGRARHLGDAGRRRVVERYSLEGMTQRTLALYTSVLAGEGPRSRRRARGRA
ncbi:MAG TPA: glycosyltransferase [Gemmatimonadaceae bacterium]|nr:glycosyltransferase [Gemmatimonadaceae bacterium]